jgi:hypothetical protein
MYSKIGRDPGILGVKPVVPSLSRAERVGYRVLYGLWSYVVTVPTKLLQIAQRL